MTDSQKIERLATEVMGWRTEADNEPDTDNTPWYWWVDENGHEYECTTWNPLTDWNHWRQVEEKVRVTYKLNTSFYEYFEGNNCNEAVDNYIGTDLPTRVDDLLAALDSLKQS